MTDGNHYGYSSYRGSGGYRGSRGSYRGGNGSRGYGYDRLYHKSNDDYYKGGSTKNGGDGEGLHDNPGSTSNNSYYKGNLSRRPSSSGYQGGYRGGRNGSYYNNSYGYSKGISKTFAGKDSYVSSKVFHDHKSEIYKTKEKSPARELAIYDGKEAKEVTKNGNASNASKSTNLDSSRIWAKLYKLNGSCSEDKSSVLDLPLSIPFKVKEKELAEKFKSDLNELDEINEKINTVFFTKLGGELMYENLKRIEKNQKLMSQLTSETLDRIVNNEGDFDFY